MRLNKYIADSGVCSRRQADALIKEGRVKINSKVITELGTEVNEANDSVTVDGNKIKPKNKRTYIMLNKPKGALCTVKDDRGRKTVMDFIDSKDGRRIFPIGRLDYDTEGLLLLTDDGDLAYRLTHPSHEIPKVYVAKIKGEVPEADLATLRKGIELDGAQLQPPRIKLLKKEEDDLMRYEVTIFEGKNREIHRMFESIGKEVEFLKRVAVGDLRLGGLARGTYRYLTEKEIKHLKTI
ncbi:MAG: rRNA pseudouridine synthase [Firmicutes bacterium]|nr:rRNA pseudouridine synthase [Bacillota bacterium]